MGVSPANPSCEASGYVHSEIINRVQSEVTQIRFRKWNPVFGVSLTYATTHTPPITLGEGRSG